MLKLYDHPLSPYAQKVKIALREKGQPFETLTPGGLGAGGAQGEFIQANPRAEVPALVDGEVMIFDSTIILEYLEDRWPTPALLPATPAERARVRMLEEAMDTHFEAINWGLSEIRWFRRAEGELERTLLARAASQTRRWFGWLESQLEGRTWFNGEAFGWGDLAVAPYLNGSVGHGFPPEKSSKLEDWLTRANARASVAQTSAEAAASANASAMPNVAELVRQGLFKREYRDHRLEWMIKSGGAQVVIDGLERDNIRFSPDFGPR